MFFEDHLDEALSRENSPDGVADWRPAGNATSSEAPPLSTSAALSSLLKSIIQATENERCAPDILPYPEAVVDGVAAQIAAQNEQISRLSAQEKQQTAERAPGTSLLPFQPSDIMALEVQRAQFFLSELLRCRLRKIESLALSIFYEGQANSDAPTQLRERLSHNEIIVADRLAELVSKYVLQAGLQAAPTELQYLVPNPPYAEGVELLPVPDLDQYVFCVVLDDLGVVRLGEDAEQTVHAGEIFLVPYRAFRPYILDGRVRLV
ncbi:GINS complex subunit 4 [Trypanosoma conorhini]|uniref:DNA replication complex GINS protein SLD5 n=1 Tax=Trypanosoma conorhini TaxID=83891 RepID=A0A3R7LE10_9TRYP|nr:GINS complex subunit 4 [Trypanosoma conorhini]RNF26537.1 GINS complex subunit 4 [Trypanosoma conorhini]